MSPRGWRLVALLVLGATVLQLAVGAFVPGLDQFVGKAFGARLLAYPAMMLVLPAGYLLAQRRGRSQPPLPWSGFALIWTPFLIDVTGNTLDLYDTVAWWDDANHFVNWALLCGGVGVLLLRTPASPPWVLGWLVTGAGAILAVVWELGEWYAFIRHGTELATAYQDTLGDEVLGTLGAAVAGICTTVVARRRLR